jgi:hypothetical protein
MRRVRVTHLFFKNGPLLQVKITWHALDWLPSSFANSSSTRIGSFIQNYQMKIVLLRRYSDEALVEQDETQCLLILRWLFEIRKIPYPSIKACAVHRTVECREARRWERCVGMKNNTDNDKTQKCVNAKWILKSHIYIMKVAGCLCVCFNNCMSIVLKNDVVSDLRKQNISHSAEFPRTCR